MSIKTNAKDWDERSSPLGVFNFSKQYLDAASILHESPGFNFSEPAYYLTGHAIELALKAFLWAKGLPISKLKSGYGHNLSRLLRDSIEQGLFEYKEEPEGLSGMIELLSGYYTNKELEYLFSGYKNYPDLKLLLPATKKVFNIIALYC